MHRDQRLFRARAELVNRLRHQFLARAAFARQQHRRARGRDLPDNFKNLPHHGRFAHHVFQAELRIELLAQGNVFRLRDFAAATTRAMRISNSSICSRPLAM